MTIQHLYEYLSGLYPASLSCAWDNDGLLCCPAPAREVRRVLVTLDVSEDAVAKAVRDGFDVILSHHPMIFKPVSAVNAETGAGRKLLSLIPAGITVMSFHTRLDAAQGGVNDVLASLLHLRDTKGFGDGEEVIGRIGTVEEISLPAFASAVKTTLHAPFVLASGRLPVHRVAVVGGDGKDYVTAAQRAGADTYLTGRLSYNGMAEAAEIGMNLIEAGHYFTEDPVCEMLCGLLRTRFPDVEPVHFSSNVINVI